MERIYIDNSGNAYNEQGKKVKAIPIRDPIVKPFRGKDPALWITGTAPDQDTASPKINAYSMGCPLTTESSNHYPVQYFYVL